MAVVPLLSGRRRTAYAQFTVDLSKYLPTYNAAEVGTGEPGGIVYDMLLVDAFFYCGPLQSNCPAWDQLGSYVVVCAAQSLVPSVHDVHRGCTGSMCAHRTTHSNTATIATRSHGGCRHTIASVAGCRTSRLC